MSEHSGPFGTSHISRIQFDLSTSMRKKTPDESNLSDDDDIESLNKQLSSKENTPMKMNIDHYLTARPDF